MFFGGLFQEASQPHRRSFGQIIWKKAFLLRAFVRNSVWKRWQTAWRRRQEVTGSCGADLLQGGGAQLDGDVGEEAVSLRAVVPDDVGVSVGLSEELHLTLGYLETLRQYSLHRYAPPIEITPEVPKDRGAMVCNAEYFMRITTVYRRNEVGCW